MNIFLVEDEIAYESLANTCGSVFNKLNWLKLFGNSLKLYGIYDNGNNLIGGFHLYFYKKYGFKLICNPYATPHIGLFFINQTTNRSSDASFNKEIIHLLTTFLSKQKCISIDVSLPHTIIDTQPLQWSDFQIKPRYTYLIDIDQNTEDIWEHFSSQRRKSIRKAVSDKLEVKQITDFKEAKLLIQKTFSRQEKNINLKLIDKILFEFANNLNSFAFMTYADGQPSAVIFCLYDNETAYYILGGYDEKNKHHGAGALAMWEAIQYAKKLGLKNFDFEGSMLPKVEEYFREFGGRLTSFYNIKKIAWPLRLIKN